MSRSAHPTLTVEEATPIFCEATDAVAREAAAYLYLQFARELGYLPFSDDRVISGPLLRNAIASYLRDDPLLRKTVANSYYGR